MRKPIFLTILSTIILINIAACPLVANLTEKQTVLVVGGAGYIGSYVNKLLHQTGYNTVVFDNLSTGVEESVKYGSFVKGDLGNVEDLNDVFVHHKIDAVIHLAAYIDVGESVSAPSKYYYNNVVNTLNLLETMRKHHVQVIIFSSSASIFGEPVYDLMDELHPKNPLSPYGRTKLMVETILDDYGKAYSLRYSSLRYFNAAGGDPEGEILNIRSNQSNLIPIAINSIIRGDCSISVFGTDYDTVDGTCVRDYVHIHDLAVAHILCMEKLLFGGESSSYNLGNGRGYSVREVLESIERVTGIPLNINESERRAGDAKMLVANPAKAKKELGWKPKYNSIDEIVRDAWNTMRCTQTQKTR